jgi:hypothetical protein
MTAEPIRRASRLAALAITLAAALGAARHAAAAANIAILNSDPVGIGFNDGTPVAPAGGNPGTTLGQQRLFAFTYAANIWGATLNSGPQIIIDARFSALACTATAAILGSAGAAEVWRDFPSAPKAGTWYPIALANKLEGRLLDTGPHIRANFNVNLGRPGCLTGTPFYLGVDGNHGDSIDFVEVLLHELAHGLGFQTFTNPATGVQLSGFPSIWDHYLLGTVTNKLWKNMTDAERAASAVSWDKLVWSGPLVTAAVPTVLRYGLAGAVISGPGAGTSAGVIRVGEADFGPAIGSAGLSGEVMPVADQTPSVGSGCEAFNTTNQRAVLGKFALLARGGCNFTVKTKNAQNAGATGVLISNNVDTGPIPPSLGGSDATITIPAVSITLSDGNRLRDNLKHRSRTGSGIFAALGLNFPQYAGADPAGRALIYAPNPFVSGSSGQHFDVTAIPHLLMEPAINGSLTQSVLPPHDLTFTLLRDIGW